MLKIGDVVIIDRFDGSYNIGVIININRHGNPNVIGSKITYSYIIEDKSQKLIEIDVDRAYSKIRLATQEEIKKEYPETINLYNLRFTSHLDLLYECIEIKLKLNKCFKFTKEYDELFKKLIDKEDEYIRLTWQM